MADVLLDDVSRVYPDGSAAVSHLSLHVRHGELMVIVGPSGCGKSTVLRLIAGLDPLGGGTISIGGRVVNQLTPGELVAFLDAGAYGMTMASNYNGQPRPAEIVVSGGEARVARRRETWEELLAAETEAGAPVAGAQGPASPLGW